MKKLNLLTILIILAFAGINFGQSITGTPHDFSGQTSWNPTGEKCVVCHTPHNAIANVEPLWNHELSTATYTLYTSSTLDATLGQPDGPSKLCLSCHDGTVAIDNFGGKTTGAEFVTGDKNLGTDLSNDHPVSFTYDATLATTDGGLFDPTTQSSGLGGIIDHDMLTSNKVQCSSCHNPHNDQYGSFLVKSNGGSALCLTCHNK